MSAASNITKGAMMVLDLDPDHEAELRLKCLQEALRLELPKHSPPAEEIVRIAKVYSDFVIGGSRQDD